MPIARVEQQELDQFHAEYGRRYKGLKEDILLTLQAIDCSLVFTISYARTILFMDPK